MRRAWVEGGWRGSVGIRDRVSIRDREKKSGLGIWTEELFLKAMRSGKHMSAGRDILPPMPWQGLAKLSDEDLRAIYAYLRTVAPVKNHVPNAVPPGGGPQFE